MSTILENELSLVNQNIARRQADLEDLAQRIQGLEAILDAHDPASDDYAEMTKFIESAHKDYRRYKEVVFPMLDKLERDSAVSRAQAQENAAAGAEQGTDQDKV